MKYTLFTLSLIICSFCFGQTMPKPADPCQKLDTNTMKNLLVGTWVDVKDTTHIMTITSDSVEETIAVTMGRDVHRNSSFWNWKLVDNIFSTDDVTCYSLREYKDGYDHHVDISINSIDSHYVLAGGEGKTIFKKK